MISVYYEEEIMKFTSCQVTGIPLDLWKKFRQQAIDLELSCNKRILQLIEDAVAMKTAGDNAIDADSIEK
jgi:hypothetical protein